LKRGVAVVQIINGNALDELKKLPDESVDCVITSPPYYGLRSYKGAETIWGGDPKCEHNFSNSNAYFDNLRYRGGGKTSVGNNKKREIFVGPEVNHAFCEKCGAWYGQLGLEPTYQMYLDHLLMVTRELKRVLKETGTLFWNMGDSYASEGCPSRHKGYSDPKWPKARNGSFDEPTAYPQGIKPKSLMMIPERFAIGMIDQGWILRNKIIWFKPNGIPSSVKDRFSNKWEYIFFFVQSKKYYFDLDAVRKPLADPDRMLRGVSGERHSSAVALDAFFGNPPKGISKPRPNIRQKYEKEGGGYVGKHSEYFNTDGSLRANLKDANPGDVIDTPAVRHKSWYSNAGHKYTYERKYDPNADGSDFMDIPTRPHTFAHFAVYPETLIEPLIRAGCPPNGVVLDPFAGSGTTGIVAERLGRNSILIEISSEYIGIINERLRGNPLTPGFSRFAPLGVV
jgi:DNA modification methylase